MCVHDGCQQNLQNGTGGHHPYFCQFILDLEPDSIRFPFLRENISIMAYQMTAFGYVSHDIIDRKAECPGRRFRLPFDDYSIALEAS